MRDSGSSLHVKEKYRPDIDGLRAIAVTLVIVFHLAQRWLPNGFIGVDIFFVISGYVVTSSVLRRSSASLTVSVMSFWKRRAVRIYPALLVCILATMLISVFLMPPFPLEQYNGAIRTGLAAIIGAANLYLFRSSQNYFTANQRFNPFLHTWSLGIEEQFYVIFSISFLLLPFLVTLISNNREIARLKWARVTLMSTLSLASAAILARASPGDEVGTYYLLHFRFWELGIGSLLAIHLNSEEPSTQFRMPYSVRQLGSIFAITIIAYVAIMPASASPNLVIAIATMSCAVLIWLNFAPDSSSNVLIAKALAWPPIINVGLVSYSLYLWHWPVFAVFATTVGLKSSGAIISAIGLVALLSVASYFLVERPLRNSQSSHPA